MQVPLQVSFHGLQPSDTLQQSIREMAAKLERYFDHITSCRVVVEREGHSQRGRQFRVRVALTLPPRREILANREHDEDAEVALHEAFADARRQLEDHVRIQRGEVKQHAG